MSDTGEAEPALSMKHIGMRFGQNWVLRDVNLAVKQGTVHAIVGHNGAGKSTLMKIALGAEVPTEGRVEIRGKRLTYSRPAEARTLGLGMVMQERSLIPTLMGLDNLFLNSERLNSVRCISLKRERQEIHELFSALGISRSLLTTQVSDMSTIEQELIEIARALRTGDRVLVLDEPTAPLGREEIDRLFAVVRRIADRGTGIVLITHHLAEVFAVSDHVTCLREGQVVLSCPTSETDMAQLIAAMLGRAASRTPSQSERRGEVVQLPTQREPMLSVRQLRVGSKLTGVSFDAYPGEILGIVGLAGSGRTTLLRALFGDVRIAAGEVLFKDKRYRPRSPQHAIAQGIFLIPEDRGIHGLVLTKSIAENIALVILRRLMTKLHLLRFSEGRDRARQMLESLDIRASGVDQLVGELSGGNQQKVVLSKALTLGAEVLLLDEPTFGVDIGATHEIIVNVRSMADRGAAVLWSTSDLVELTHVADRLVVLRDGVIGATIERGEVGSYSEDQLVAMMQRGQFQRVAAGSGATNAAN